MLSIPNWGWPQQTVAFSNRLLDWANHNAAAIKWSLCVMVAFYSAAEIFGHKEDVGWANSIAITGYLTGLLFLLATRGMRAKYEAILDSAVERQVICLYPPPATGSSTNAEGSAEQENWSQAELLAALKSRIEITARTCGVVLGGVLAMLSIAWFSSFGVNMETITQAITGVVGFVLSVTMSLVIGLRAGRMACYGWQGISWSSPNIATSQAAVSPQIGDPDNLCGLKELSSFYEFLAGRLMWPIIYCVVWLLVLVVYTPSYIEAENLARLKMTIWTGLFILIFLQVTGFVIPICCMGQKLKRDRECNLGQFKKHVDEIAKLQARLEECPATERPGIMTQLTFLRTRREDIYNMPRWPIRSRNLRWFTLRKAMAAILPVAANIVADAPAWVTDSLHSAGQVMNLPG